MSTVSIYRLTQPTVWASAPDAYSYSSLANIERCPLQWQLTRSCYGDLDGFPSRPNSAAAEGDIIHQVLEQLFRSLALRGLPHFGTDAFRDCVSSVNVRSSVTRLVQEHDAIVATHPRGASFRLRRNVQQLVNQVIHMFRGMYAEASRSSEGDDKFLPLSVGTGPVPTGKELAGLLLKRKALSELPLSHPTLPFKGIIDLVYLKDGRIVIVDFKTGSERVEHETQVRIYAVLWWRCSGEIVHSCEVRYPSGKRSIVLTERDLIAAEALLEKRIALAREQLQCKPAKAVVGGHCGMCDVRQFCDSYWSKPASKSPAQKLTWRENETIDIELTIISPPSPHGFEARASGGKTLSVVYHQAELQLHGPFEEGERLRIVRGTLGKENGEIHLKNWTEVFHVA